MDHIGFRPRRLGHANLFVSDLERSIAFYERVCGIELVRREPAIHAAFHSNGNTHHDIGLIQCTGGVRRGIGGFVQPSSFRGHAPGLNHLAWEMDSEAALIEAIARAEAAGVNIVNYANHQISHSVYVPDPDGNYHEFYADVVPDWRTIFNLDRDELVTERWNWQRSRPGLGAIRAPADERHVGDAPFHPRRITHAVLAVTDVDRSISFFEDVAGLTCSDRNRGSANLHGDTSALDLMLVAAGEMMMPGLVGISFLARDASAIDEGECAARTSGQAIDASHDTASKRSVVVQDPDGLLIEFYAPRTARLPLPDVTRAGSSRAWCFAA